MTPDYRKNIIVESRHLDELNHVNNVVYLQWVQDIAKEHWLSLVTKKLLEEFFWVVRSHHLEYRKQVFTGNELLVKTFVVNYKGPFSERAVEFYLNDELVVEARSNWCLLGMQDQKPTRVPDDIQKLFGSRED